MTNTLIKSRYIKNKKKPKPEVKMINKTLPQNLQIFKEKLLSGNGFLSINEHRRFSTNRWYRNR